jgi:chlorobactene glucosyltransferase
MMALEVLLWISAGLWVLSALWAVLNWVLVPSLSAGGSEVPIPSLSVVIPARDEEEWIGPAVESHCSQDYPGLQVVVVDDGSTDRTPAILSDLKARYPNLTVVSGEEPSHGWFGKPNAMRQGLERAAGELVLLADADIRYGPGTHRRAAAELARDGLDMLVLLPRHEGPWAAQLVVLHLDAFFLFGMPSFLYNVPRFRAVAMGAGAGNLLRWEALREIGGMEALKGEVVEDVALGRKVKALRGRLRVVKAFGDVRVRMYGSLRAAVEGFTKNLYGFMGYSLRNVALAFLAGALYHLVPLGVLVAYPWVPPGLLLTSAAILSLELALETATCLWSRHPLWLALLFPVRLALWWYLLLRSAWRYHRRGIVWRGRVYGKGQS